MLRYKSFKIDCVRTILFLLLMVAAAFPQKNNHLEKRYGSVSFISSQHIYVKFEKTDSISVGDTLFYSTNNSVLPAVIIKYISSRSCAGDKIINTDLKAGDILFANIRTYETNSATDSIKKDNIITVPKDSVSKAAVPKPKITKKNYWGRFSIQSMSGFSNTSNSDDQRWRYSFSFNADSIEGSGFSFSSYLFFAYNVKDWSDIKNNPGNALKVYDLSVGYAFDNSNKIWLGRYLNPKISNVGSIDGIQYQFKFGKYYMGTVAGSHPSFSDYGYDIKMFEFGGYFGRVDTVGRSQMENTVAFMDQTNDFKTDRRYIYFQHTNNLLPNTYLFASSEFDLYKIDNGTKENIFDLTSLFVNLNITPLRFISMSLSFDARKNAIYYESYKTYLENLIANELRKGFRASIYLRPFDNISISVNGGYSSQNSDPKPARNYGANFYCYNIPLLGISGNVSYSKLISSYTNGTISGFSLSKYITSLELNLSVDYKNIQYQFDNGIDPLIQNTGSVSLSFKLPFNSFLGLNYEGVFEKQNSWGRFFIDLTTRF